MQDLQWNCLEFGSLSPELLYALLQLRTEVFVMEQNCAYQDMDGNDQAALHVTGHLDAELVCYARVLPPGLKYSGASIGRVITAKKFRGGGYGRQLMIAAIGYCQQHFADESITLSAQQQLEDFYLSMGFVTVSAAYMEDGIPHIEMLMHWPEKNQVQ
ncbi:MAG: GNAT family N-acetyltransferase [Proteobacteria bacterium]|nr:GNAT family N-acetyltransferase [Pseudomonadota bacterium]